MNNPIEMQNPEYGVKKGPLMIDVFGADLGYGIIKLYGPKISLNLQSKIQLYDKISYFSVIHELIDMDGKDDSSELMATGLNIKNLIIKYNDKTYLVGFKAVKMYPTRTGRDYDEDKYAKIEDTLKFLVGLSCMYPNETEFVIDTLVVGLSLESFVKHKDQLIKKYTDFKITYEVPSSRGIMQTVTVQINKCRCIAQGDGVFFDNILEITANGTATISLAGKELQALRCGIIDIGSKTIDCFIKEGFEKVPGSNIVFPHGITYAYQYVSKYKMNNCDPNRIENEYLTYIHKEPNEVTRPFIRWDQQKYDIETVVRWCKEGFQIVAQEILTEIDKNPLWKEEYKVLDLMVIAGGSGPEIFDIIKSHFNKYGFEIRMAADPKYSNVRGYVKAELFRKRFSNQKNEVK